MTTERELPFTGGSATPPTGPVMAALPRNYPLGAPLRQVLVVDAHGDAVCAACGRGALLADERHARVPAGSPGSDGTLSQPGCGTEFTRYTGPEPRGVTTITGRALEYVPLPEAWREANQH
jgi:hypothetical protein